MSNVIEFRGKMKEIKKAELKKAVADKIQEGKEWVIDNSEALMTLMPVVIGGIATVTKVAGKGINLHKEESMKNLYCYDRSLGHYWRLRRALSNQEWLEIDRRKSNGERLADILAELKVLK